MTHRRALDHVLAVVAAHPVGDILVLRGSMAMTAWVGDRARPPGDLDFVVMPGAGVPIDPRDPWPYTQNFDPARLWPEVAHGAGNPRMWEFEDFDTGGLHPHLPPEGLRWMEPEELDDNPHQELLEAIGEQPESPDGVVLEPGEAKWDTTWGYSYDPESGGARVRLPWRRDAERGTVQLDFAYDERLPEPPVFAAVPREAGGPPTVVRSASRELSLAWKLRWLATDQVTDGRSAGKDLYDAALLAASPDLLVSATLGKAVDSFRAVERWRVDWGDLPGDPDDCLARLAGRLSELI